MENQVFNFESAHYVRLENSFGKINNFKMVKFRGHVGFHNRHLGWFEIYDMESGGEEWHAMGDLFLDGKVVTGYDGVFSLPECVMDKLEELGFDVSPVAI